MKISLKLYTVLCCIGVSLFAAGAIYPSVNLAISGAAIAFVLMFIDSED